MTRQPLSGIDGVLDNLLSPGHAHVVPNANTKSAPVNYARVSAASHSGSPRATGARRGRPMGPHRRESGPKEKVTFRISSELATKYRNWSWEARCSLSTLVEKALREYCRRQVELALHQQSELRPPENLQNNV